MTWPASPRPRPPDIQDLVAAFHSQNLPVLFGAGVEVDLMNSKAYGYYLAQSGLGMPDRDYYTRDDADSRKLREQYLAHVGAMLKLLGDGPEQAAAEARTVMTMETRLAKASKTRVEMRDIPGLYNKKTLAQLQESCSGFDWSRYLENIGRPDISDFIVMAPAFFKEMGSMLKEIPLDDWKTYLRWQALSSYAPYLSSAFVNENFNFFLRVMEGTQEIEERWKRMTSLTSASLDQLVGQMYVEKYFPASCKLRMEELSANIKNAFATRLRQLPWMSDKTRQQAMEKLLAMRIEVGYPEQMGGLRQAGDRPRFAAGQPAPRRALRLSKEPGPIGQTGGHVQMGHGAADRQCRLQPCIQQNDLPGRHPAAAVLFADGDDAVNYGAIGMAIGHEMSHGFDDQGRWFDKDGNMRDWWTPEDSEKFKQQTKLLVEQYNAFTSEDGVHVNGELSLGENIADYAGLTMSLAGYHLSLAGKKTPEAIDGFSGDQRFFLAFAQVWRGKIRPEALKKKIQEDVHPWGEFRVNGAPFNVADFYRIFDIQPGDKLYRAPAQRPAIW